MSRIAILNRANLLHNVQVIKQQAANSKLIVMVKANAYGHGIRSVAKSLDGVVDMFGVACIDEALILRDIGIKTPIMLAEGVFAANELVLAAIKQLHVVFHHQAQLDWLQQVILPLPLKAWIKVDTGMGRLGFALEEFPKVYNQLEQHDNIIKPLGIMSHFACAEQIAHPLNVKQIERFQHIYQNYRGEYSFCNSAAIWNFPDHHHTYIRPGISIYGASPFKDKSADDLGLKPVMTLQSNIIAIQTKKAGDTIGYGAHYICPNDMQVAVVAFGYGDGYPRNMQNNAPLLVRGKICPLIGRVSMDMITIDVSDCKEAQVGDQVTLWGEGLPINALENYTDHISYDLLTAVQNRVKFYWTL